MATPAAASDSHATGDGGSLQAANSANEAAATGNAASGDADTAPTARKQNGANRKTKFVGKQKDKKRGWKDRGKNEVANPNNDTEAPDAWSKIKRRRLDREAAPGPSYMSHAFSAEEIAAEERRPKRRVAALIGYAGTGYHGLQINHEHRTIEGDLFKAFVEAGAISKANADDPLKSKLVRCARTDRGVHAAGNVLSLNMIIEDEDVVKKINDKLPAQIRLWGIERTNKKFNCHVACDSRWYEYLLPSYALLPPHPYSFLAKRIKESAVEKGVAEQWKDRLGDVKEFWDVVDEEIKPILENLMPDIRQAVQVILHAEASTQNMIQEHDEDDEGSYGSEDAAEASTSGAKEEETGPEPAETESEVHSEAATDADQAVKNEGPQRESDPSGVALREIKQVWMRAKKAYRISASRIAQLQQALDRFVGTHNFHNYTIQKSFHDASAKRHIKSFVVDPTPIIKNDTEWLSLKVHGQSFMMHQIRKMVAMAALVVRTGAPGALIDESYGRRRISIPKAPGLGLLLERPVFEVYNKRAADQFEKGTLDFDKYEKEMREFKDREIYSRMFETEGRFNTFSIFFTQIDNFSTDYFLWCTPGGMEASYERSAKGLGPKLPKALEATLGEDPEEIKEAQGEGGDG